MNEPLSVWGWGHASKFPPTEERNALAEQVGMMLGLPGLSAREPVALDDVEMPAPRMEIPAALASFCTVEKAERARHSYGRSFPDILRGFQGRYDSPPDIVAYPTEEAHIEAALLVQRTWRAFDSLWWRNQRSRRRRESTFGQLTSRHVTRPHENGPGALRGRDQPHSPHPGRRTRPRSGRAARNTRADTAPLSPVV